MTPLLRPISAVDDHLRIAAGLVSTRMVDNDGSTVLAQFSGAEVHMRVPTRVRLPADHRRRQRASHRAPNQCGIG